LRVPIRIGPPLRLAVLFGSRATGSATPGSDVDVGILPRDASRPLHEELALAAAISQAAGAEADLVRLDRDDPLLGREVAQTGLCVYESEPGAFAAYRATAMSCWIDFNETFAPHQARFLRSLARTVA